MLQNTRDWPKFSFEGRVVTNLPSPIGGDSRENLVVIKCISQSRFEP